MHPTGRFISQDPTSFAAGDANLYRYVGNSPINATDPTGLYLVVKDGQKGKPIELYFGKDNVEYVPIPGKPGWFKVKLKDGAALHLEDFVKDGPESVKAYAAWLYYKAHSDPTGSTLEQLAAEWSEIIDLPRQMTPEQCRVWYKKYCVDHPTGGGFLQGDRPPKPYSKWDELTPAEKARISLLIGGRILVGPH